MNQVQVELMFVTNELKQALDTKEMILGSNLICFNQRYDFGAKHQHLHWSDRIPPVMFRPNGSGNWSRASDLALPIHDWVIKRRGLNWHIVERFY
jgi:hypothetical protein